MKVDFYVLEQNSHQQALLMACQLVEAAYKNQQTIYIHASSAEEANKIDALLWTFRDDSFVPHEIYEEGTRLQTTQPGYILDSACRTRSGTRNDGATCDNEQQSDGGPPSFRGLSAESSAVTPIQIGHDSAPPHRGTLVNLTKEIPAFYQQFQRVVEIVFSDPSVQQLARERYKEYRENGCDITTHKIKANNL